MRQSLKTCTDAHALSTSFSSSTSLYTRPLPPSSTLMSTQSSSKARWNSSRSRQKITVSTPSSSLCLSVTFATTDNVVRVVLTSSTSFSEKLSLTPFTD